MENATALKLYLEQKGFNSEQETAADLSLDEAGFSLAIEELEESGVHVHRGTRRDSYGREVIWL